MPTRSWRQNIVIDADGGRFVDEGASAAFICPTPWLVSTIRSPQSAAAGGGGTRHRAGTTAAAKLSEWLSSPPTRCFGAGCPSAIRAEGLSRLLSRLPAARERQAALDIAEGPIVARHRLLSRLMWRKEAAARGPGQPQGAGGALGQSSRLIDMPAYFVGIFRFAGLPHHLDDLTRTGEIKPHQRVAE
jgi:hypothetical protein